MSKIELMMEAYDCDTTSDLGSKIAHEGKRLDEEGWGQAHGYSEGVSAATVRLSALDGVYCVYEGVLDGWEEYHLTESEEEAWDTYHECCEDMEDRSKEEV